MNKIQPKNIQPQMNFRNNNNGDAQDQELKPIKSLTLKKNGQDFFQNSTTTFPNGGNNQSKLSPTITDDIHSRISRRIENKNQTPFAADPSNGNPLSQQNTQAPRMNVKKQIPGEASKLIRRTSSSIDEKSRTEAQTPTQMNKQKLNSVKAPVAITGAGNVQASQLIQSQQKEIKQETLTPHAPEVVNSTVTIKPKLTLNFEKRQIPVTQKAEVSNQIISSLSVNENSQPKIQTEQRKIPMNNNSNNQSTFAKLSPPTTNPLLKNQPTLISNIQNQNKQLPIVQSTSLQAVNVPQPTQSEGQSNICKSDLSGKRSASSLKDLSDSEIKETTEKKIKPNSNQRDYDNLKKDIIKEMKIDEDMNEDCSSSVSSHATVVIKSSIISKTITPIDQLLSQEREDISRKTSDFSDDSQKSNTSSLTANSQESIQQALKKQRKRTEHLELKNKIDQNLSFIETKQDKIRRITQLVSEQLTPQMMKLLKETVQKQKELLYQSHGISEKKQNKINSKLLNQILSNNAQLLKDLKI